MVRKEERDTWIEEEGTTLNGRAGSEIDGFGKQIMERRKKNNYRTYKMRATLSFSYFAS